MNRSSIFAAISLASVLTFSAVEAKSRPWWATALVDASGALSGGLGASVLGPWGTLGGAVLGGAGASLAIANPGSGGTTDVSAGPERIIWNPNGGGCTEINLPKPFGCGGTTGTTVPRPRAVEANAGYWHNRIVRAYVAENNTYNREAFVRVALRELASNPQQTRTPLTTADVNRFAALGETVAATAASGRGDRRPVSPETSAKLSKLKSDVEALFETENASPNLHVRLGEIEQNFKNDATVSQQDKALGGIYLDVLRSSAAYWRNSEAIAFGNCMTEPTRCGTLPRLPIGR